MNVKKWAAALTCAGAGLFGLTACGGDETSAPEVATFKGAPIVIGTICSCTSNQSAVLKDSTQGLLAWVDHVNKNDGLNGHPVKLIVKDDAGDSAKGLQAAKELVDEGAVAIVGMTSTTDAAWQSFVEEKKIPVVGGLSTEATFLTSADFFPAGANAVLQTYGALQTAKDAGLKKFGVLYCAETPVCAQVDGIGGAFASQVGIGYTSAKVSATSPDYNSPCLALKDDGVDALFIAHNASVIERVGASCKQNGFQPQGVGLMSGIDSSVIKDPNFDGMLLIGEQAMYTDESVAGVKEYRDAMEDYNPGFVDTAGFNTPSESAWSGGKLFEAAAKAADLGPDSTSADVYQGLYALKGETLGGMAPPLTFAEGQPAFPPCYFQGKVTDGGLEAAGSEPVCLDEGQLGQIAELLKAMA